MNNEKKLSEAILDDGKDFPIDTMPDYDDRVASGEFANKTPEEIRSIYFNEALADEEAEELEEHYRTINEMEEAEEDGRDFHIPVDDEEDDEEEDEEDDEDDEEE